MMLAMAPCAFLSALLLLLVPGGAAIEVASLSRTEADAAASRTEADAAFELELELRPELDDKSKHSHAHKAKAKSSPALDDKATHSHSSTHGHAGHDKARHGSTQHAKAKHSTAVHEKALHGHSHSLKAHHSSELHGKATHSTELHGKTKAKGSSALHEKVTHGSELHQKAKQTSMLHGKAKHSVALHGKAATKEKAKTKTGHALHGKAAAKAEKAAKAATKAEKKAKGKTSPAEHKKKEEEGVTVEEEEEAEGVTKEADVTDTACEDVVNGSVCYTAVSWLRSDGFKKHPDWYPAYGADSTFREVQAMLYSLGKSHCPKPCMQLEGGKGDTGKVLEIDANGRQVYSEGHMLAQTSQCKDAVEGEYCFSSILWLAAKGVKKHPEWYPHLSLDSSFRDAQEELFRDNKSDCTRPCLIESNAAKLYRVDAQKTAKTKRAKVNLAKHLDNPCLDAAPETPCHMAVKHALKEGIKNQPEMYPGLPARADFRDVQENLFFHGKNECQRPCPATDPDAATNSTDAEGQKRVQDMTLAELVEYIEAQRTSTTAAKAAPAEDSAGEVQHYDPNDQDMRNETVPAEGAQNASSAEASEAASASLVSVPSALVNDVNSVSRDRLPLVDQNGAEV